MVLAGRSPSIDNERLQASKAGLSVQRSHSRIAAIAWVPLLACQAALLIAPYLAAAEPNSPPKYARPPKWPKDVIDTFFPDATAKLVGSRPDYGKQTPVANSDQLPGADSTIAPTEGGWSKLIDADTIETEIKRIVQLLNKTITAPAQFKGGGYKDCRRDFSVLAALFAVIAEYDGEVRWKDAAPQLRNEFAPAPATTAKSAPIKRFRKQSSVSRTLRTS